MHLEFAFGFFGLAPNRGARPGRQLSLQRGNIAQRAVVGSARALTLHVGRSHDVNLMPQVIKRQKTIEKHELGVGQVQVILGVLTDLLQLPHDVVGK